MAAPWQGLPVRLERAPHRGAAFALSNASKRARIRSIGSRSRGSLFIGSRSRGSLFIFRSSPAVAPPAPRHRVARDHGLPAIRDVHLSSPAVRFRPLSSLLYAMAGRLGKDETSSDNFKCRSNRRYDYRHHVWLRRQAQIVAVQLDQIERIEKHALIMAAIRTRLNEVTPLASQPTASPSMMQVLGKSASASSGSGRLGFWQETSSRARRSKSVMFSARLIRSPRRRGRAAWEEFRDRKPSQWRG
jgi:hypothetical protein